MECAVENLRSRGERFRTFPSRAASKTREVEYLGKLAVAEGHALVATTLVPRFRPQ